MTDYTTEHRLFKQFVVAKAATLPMKATMEYLNREVFQEAPDNRDDDDVQETVSGGLDACMDEFDDDTKDIIVAPSSSRPTLIPDPTPPPPSPTDSELTPPPTDSINTETSETAAQSEQPVEEQDPINTRGRRPHAPVAAAAALPEEQDQIGARVRQPRTVAALPAERVPKTRVASKPKNPKKK